MKNSFAFVFSLTAAFAMVTVPVSCTDYEALTNSPVVEGDKPYATYDIDWTQAADSCSQAFIKRFYCSENRNGYQWVFSYNAYNNGQLNGNNYWQQAHCMNAVVDYYNRIKDSNPEEAATIENYFQKWYEKKGNNYEGNATYRGTTGFGNDFTDDTCWITIALLQMYDATGNQTYFDTAKTLWDEDIWPRHMLNQYGWLPWKYTDLGANECTNGPGAIIAAMMSAYAKEAGNEEAAAEYLEQAYTCFDQNLDVMASDGTLGSIPLSYTQGTCMEAGRLIWHLSGDEAYLIKAVLAARGQMESSRMNEAYNGEYISRDEGPDENNSIFHAVMFHWAARMIMDSEIDAVDPEIRHELYTYLRRHAEYYWTLGIDKDDFEDSYFGVKCYQPREDALEADPDNENLQHTGSQGAFASAAQCIESMWLVKDLF